MSFDAKISSQPIQGQEASSYASLNYNFQGQTALVTGAHSGIGRALALAYGAAGANVVINDLTDAPMAEEIAQQIVKSGGRAITLKADVSNETEVEAMFAQAIREFGTIHISVSNAGLQQDAAFDEMTLEQWSRVINVNLTGQFLCQRAAVREFKRRGMQPEVSRALGKIICMSSVHQEIPWAGHANYASSKGGVMMMMESLAQEVAPLKIRVNGIAPGAIRTPINRSAWSTEDAYKKLLELIPYRRIGEVIDIARAGLWLASDESDYVTGTTLYVDGGMTLFPEFATGG